MAPVREYCHDGCKNRELANWNTLPRENTSTHLCASYHSTGMPRIAIIHVPGGSGARPDPPA